MFTPTRVGPVDHAPPAEGPDDDCPGEDCPGEGMYRAVAHRPLPWQSGHPVQAVDLPSNSTWQHLVLGGVIGLDRLYEQLTKVFGESADDVAVEELLPTGDTALFCLGVDADGRADLQTLTLSAAAWCLGRAQQPGIDDPHWSDGFDVARRRHRAAVSAVLARAARRPPNAPGQASADLRLRCTDLEAITARTVDFLELAGLTDQWEIRIRTRRIRRPAAPPVTRSGTTSAPGQRCPLNSPLLDDLDRIAPALASGDVGRALSTYLTEDDEIDQHARQDVREEHQLPLLQTLLAPSRIPPGRWPADLDRPLPRGHQLAVTEVMHRLAEGSGLFAVHAAPGTDRTAMLRETIAAVLVERAQQLSALARPAAAFTERLTWRADQRTRWLTAISPALTGFELVVTAENADRLADLTRDIPATDGIGASWQERANYFAEHAQRLLGAPVWGLLAAPLGSPGDRQRFVEQFWYGDPEPGDRSASAGAADPRRMGFLAFLRTVDSGSIDWVQEVRAFRAAVERQDRLQAERSGLDVLLTELQSRSTAAPQIYTRLAQATARAGRAADLRDAAVQAVDEAEAVERAATARRAEHARRRPSNVETLFTLGRSAQEWREEDAAIVRDLAEADRRVQEAAQQLTIAQTTAMLQQDTADQIRSAWENNERRLIELNSAVMSARSAWGEDLPDDSWWREGDRQEHSGPWLDAAWNQARTELLLAALRLHAAFVVATADVLCRNLTTTTMLLRGQVPADLPEPVARAAWQSLFLVVPVVSTTLDALPRLFGHLSREALGWLVVDEANQVRAQAVVGALWRARRVVTLGDRHHLEPVPTVPEATDQALRELHDVAATWSPAGSSAQALADRVNPIGTWLAGAADQEPVWVGVPLRVHRRSAEPMFSLVNRLAYDQMLVPAQVSDPPPLPLVNSRWVDVSGPAEHGAWVPAEAEATEQLLDHLIRRQGLDPGQVLVLSPFRAVVAGLRRRLRAQGVPGVAISGVQMAQDGEYAVVVLVLGSDPERARMRVWAARRPNLLNAAVGLARHRLYVVGNRALWAQQPYFAGLAESLERREFVARQM